MPNYSPQHVAAYQRWMKGGFEEISERDIELIEKEDPETGAHIRKERVRRAEEEAERRRRLAPPAPATPNWHWSKMAEGESIDDYLKRHYHLPMSTAIFDGFQTAIFDLFKALRDENQKRDERLAKLELAAVSGQRAIDLEERLLALEDRPTLKYEGVWLEGKTYPQGSVATLDGSMWHANIATRSKPGQSREWTLCVKRGRPGRHDRE